MIPDGHDWMDIVSLVIAAVVAVGGLATLIGLIVSRGKTHAEASKTEAETSLIYQQIADQAATRALKLEERVKMLEDTLSDKDQRIDELERANSEKDAEIASLRAQVDALQQKVEQLEGRRK